MEPLISIIIPVHNNENYLDECIQSVLKQNYGNFEVLLIDDGSTDESVSICDRYARQDARIIVEHKSNGGVSSARNRALQMAKGEYITFLDSDDLLPEDALNRYVELISSNNADMIIGRTARFVKDKNRFTFNNKEFRVDEIKAATSNEIMMCWVKKEITNVVWGNLYRRSIIETNSIAFDTDLSMAEDGDWLFRYILNAKSFDATNYCVYLQRRDPDSPYFIKLKYHHTKSSLIVYQKWFDYFSSEFRGKDKYIIASRFADVYLSSSVKIRYLYGNEREDLKKLFQSRKDILDHVSSKANRVLVEIFRIFGYEIYSFCLAFGIRIKRFFNG